MAYAKSRPLLAELHSGVTEGSTQRIGKDWGGDACTNRYCLESDHDHDTIFPTDPCVSTIGNLKGIVDGPVDSDRLI